MKFPKTPGACVDKLYELEEERAAAQRVLDGIKKMYNELEEHLIQTLPKDELDGAIGKTATARIKRTNVPTADDWDAIRAYVVKKNAWDLIQKRLSTAACIARWDDPKVKTIPGVGVFTKISLSLTKRS